MSGHESIDLKDRPALRDRFDILRELGVRIDIVHLRGLQRRDDGSSGQATATAARKERPQNSPTSWDRSTHTFPISDSCTITA